MADEKIDIGDTVRLKSGGPLMTVSEWRNGEMNKQVCRCAWFNGSNETFTEVCLNIATLKKVTLKKVERANPLTMQPIDPIEQPTPAGLFAQLMRHNEAKDREIAQLMQFTIDHTLADNKRLRAAAEGLHKDESKLHAEIAGARKLIEEIGKGAPPKSLSRKKKA